jgi:hypothetical protein
MIKEHARQTAFLHSLVLCCEGEHARELLRRLSKARHEDRVIRCAVLLAAAAGLLALMAFGYAAVLVPEFLLRDSHLLRGIQALAVASLGCVVVFLPYWWWMRTVFNALHEECRRFVMQHLKGNLVVRHEEAFVHLVSQGNPPHRASSPRLAAG